MNIQMQPPALDLNGRIINGFGQMIDSILQL